jgi:hypothetical protein
VNFLQEVIENLSSGGGGLGGSGADSADVLDCGELFEITSEIFCFRSNKVVIMKE